MPIAGTPRGTLARTLDRDPCVAFAYLRGSFLSDELFHDIDVYVWLAGAPGGGRGTLIDLAASFRRDAPPANSVACEWVGTLD
jgi:hypothetical protein